MFVVPSTVQLLLTVVLFVLGVCGNLMIPFLSYRTTLRCPHTTVLTVLDITATLIGPGLMLVTLTTGPTWLEHNQSLCQALSVLSSCVQISCFMVFFLLALFCQKVHYSVHRDERRRVMRREFAFLVVCLWREKLKLCFVRRSWRILVKDGSLLKMGKFGFLATVDTNSIVLYKL